MLLDFEPVIKSSYESAVTLKKVLRIPSVYFGLFENLDCYFYTYSKSFIWSFGGLSILCVFLNSSLGSFKYIVILFNSNIIPVSVDTCNY